MTDFSKIKILTTLKLEDGRRVVLFDYCEKSIQNDEAERARNIFLYDENGDVLWRIHSEHDQDGRPYTNIYFESDEVYAFRSDGFSFIINIETGEAKIHEFLK